MSGEWKDKVAHAAYLDSLIGMTPDPEEVLPLDDAATNTVRPAADTQDLTAGGPQEPRSDLSPTSPTDQKRQALRIDLRAGIVDLRSVPSHLRYFSHLDEGEYRRVLDAAINGGWGFVCSTSGVPSGFVIVARGVVA